MKLVTITHSAEGIRICRDGTVQVYANSIYLAEAVAQAQHRIEELEGQLRGVRGELAKPGEDLQALCERLTAVLDGRVPF